MGMWGRKKAGIEREQIWGQRPLLGVLEPWHRPMLGQIRTKFPLLEWGLALWGPWMGRFAALRWPQISNSRNLMSMVWLIENNLTEGSTFERGALSIWAEIRKKGNLTKNQFINIGLYLMKSLTKTLQDCGERRLGVRAI